MITALALVLLGWLPPVTHPEPNVNELLTRLQTLAAKGAPSAELESIQGQLEWVLYRDLMTVYLGGGELDRKTLQIAAGAQLPELQVFALHRLANGITVEDATLALEALDSPYPAVREAALELARGSSDPRIGLILERVKDSHSRKGTGLIADPAPEAKSLGAPLYPDADYRYLASMPDFPVFTSQDPVDKVLAFYAKGRKVLTGPELQALAKTSEKKASDQEQAALFMAALSQGKDPQELIQEMTEAEQARKMDWTQGIEGVNGINSPRYVVLEATGPRKLPSRVVAVYRDDALGATAMAFRAVPDAKAAARAFMPGQDPAYIQALLELMSRQ